MQPVNTDDIHFASLRQQLSDLRERGRISGVFYFLGTLLVLWLSPSLMSTWWFSLPLLAVLLVVAVLRASLPLPDDELLASWRRQWHYLWSLIFTNVVLWSVFTLVVHLRYPSSDAQNVLMLATAMFASAFAYAFCMNLTLARLGLLLLCAPTIVILWLSKDQYAYSFAITAFCLHLSIVVASSCRNYRERLQLDAELRRQRDSFKQLSLKDPLTSLHNRSAFNQSLDRAISDGRGFALVMFDIDHFKQINDRFGHLEGDRCITQVAAMMQQSFTGPEVLLARLGGEEFAAVLPGLLMSEAWELAEQFRNHLAASDIGVTISAGVFAVEPKRVLSSQAVYQAVDQALYRAKEAGRNCVRS
jgi:diguanylate cyclase (GGDEF)-like protein